MSNSSSKKEVYRTDVLLWERAGKPIELCTICNKKIIRVGLDICCEEEESKV